MKTLDKQAYRRLIQARYRRAKKSIKSRILDEFCAVCGYNRKYAISLLKQPCYRLPPSKGRPGPKKRYDDPQLLKVLQRLWWASDLVCSKRLKAVIPLWLPYYKHHYNALTPTLEAALLTISPATIDRLLKPTRDKLTLKKRCRTKPGSLLMATIPLSDSPWEIEHPGFLEADTVAHCGSSLRGDYVWSLTMTDIRTAWTENRATWNKGATGVIEQIQDIESLLPFDVTGFDSDCGTEFLNHHLVRYLADRPIPVKMTRSRPYHKNDNAHVEQKNWTHVRRLFGYVRLGHPRCVSLMNSLYRNEWRAYQNFFIPTMKLIKKTRQGSRYHRFYDAPKTAYHRLTQWEDLPPSTRDSLNEYYHSLDPFLLKKAIEKKRDQIIHLAS